MTEAHYSHDLRTRITEICNCHIVGHHISYRSDIDVAIPPTTGHWSVDDQASAIHMCDCLIGQNHPTPHPDGEPLSLYDSRVARQIAATDPPFAALIAAAVMRADTAQAARLVTMFPGICESLVERATAPGNGTGRL